MMRTDSHNNPAAITTDIAHQAGLVLGTDYTQGDPFTIPAGILYTARLIGDPVALTIRVINDIGYYTLKGTPRWEYISMPRFVWNSLPDDGPAGGTFKTDPASGVILGPTAFSKRDVIGFHYSREGGVTMRSLFPNYGKL